MDLAEDLNTPVEALPHADQDYFPNIHTLMLIMINLPITSCECERSISLLRFVKSTLRTTMTEERLNGLAIMQYHPQPHLGGLGMILHYCGTTKRDSPLN